MKNNAINKFITAMTAFIKAHIGIFSNTLFVLILIGLIYVLCILLPSVCRNIIMTNEITTMATDLATMMLSL